MKTTSAKSFTTWFLPVDPAYLECFTAWVTYLRQSLLVGNDDALFRKPDMGLVNGGFAALGLSRDTYSNAGKIREVVKAVFVSAGLSAFAPHSFSKTLVKRADKTYSSREAFKAFSKNFSHDSEITTVGSYLKVLPERQAELIRG